MDLKFSTIKKPISKKEKIERAKDFNYFNELDPGDLDCKKEETLESDIVFE